MIRVSARSAAAATRLWAVTSDVVRWGEWLTTFESVTPQQPGPMRVGSRYRVKQPGLLTAVYEVTHLDQGRAFTWVASVPGVTTTATHLVHEEPNGSRLDLTLEWTGPGARFVHRALGGQGQRMVTTEAETFARLAEQG